MRWKSDFTCYLLQDDNDDIAYNLLAICCLNWRSKVNHLHHSLVWNKPKCEISPSMKKWRLPPCRAQGEDCEDVHIAQICCPRFGRFTLKCTPYNFNGRWFSCSYRSVGVTHTCFVDLCVYVWVLRINVTLLCKHRMSNVLFWPIFSDMVVVV